MSVTEKSATALVRCTGLAMICHNEQHQRVEMGFIHDAQHEFTLKVKKAAYVNGSNDKLEYVDVIAYHELPTENVGIEIKAQGAPVSGCQIYTNGDFNRETSTDLNDFRWLVSMEELHGQNHFHPTSTPPYPLTKVHILDGLIYTHQLDEIEFEKVKQPADGVAGTRETFGRVAQTLGAVIEGHQIALTVRTADKEVTHYLPRIDVPYIFELANMDYDLRVVTSDMPEYYKFFSNCDGDQFELKRVGIRGEIGMAKNQVDFCHPVVVPPEIIDGL